MSQQVQYTNDGASTFSQTVITREDLKIFDNSNTRWLDGDLFSTIKDSNDTCYLFVGLIESYYQYLKVFKILRDGSFVFSTMYVGAGFNSDQWCNFYINRDETRIYFNRNSGTIYQRIYYINIADIVTGATITPTLFLDTSAYSFVRFDMYKDLYTWVAGNSVICIYDSDYQTLITSLAMTTALAFCGGFDSGDRVLSYAVNANEFIQFEYDSISNTIIPSVYTHTAKFANAKYMKMDIDGNLLIMITPPTGNSSIIKMSRAGVELGETLVLVGLYAGLDTDIDGNVYWWKTESTVRSFHSSAGVGAGSRIRETGLSTYGSNITGYYPSIQV